MAAAHVMKLISRATADAAEGGRGHSLVASASWPNLSGGVSGVGARRGAIGVVCGEGSATVRAASLARGRRERAPIRSALCAKASKAAILKRRNMRKHRRPAALRRRPSAKSTVRNHAARPRSGARALPRRRPTGLLWRAWRLRGSSGHRAASLPRKRRRSSLRHVA